MALPAQRINYVTNPAPASTTGFSNSGGAGTWSYNTSEAQPFARFTKDATAAATGFLWGAAAQVTGAIGTVVSFRLWVRTSFATTWTPRNNLTALTGQDRALTANTWTEVTVQNHAVTVADFRLGGLIGTVPAAGTVDLKLAIVEKASTSPDWFSGASTDPSYTFAWTGTANASTSTKDYYGVWVEQVVAAGAPRVQVTAIGLGNTAKATKITRKAGREVWTVPGWRSRNTVGGDTYTDWTPPLGVPVTYSLFVAGQAVSNMTITVTSTTGWIQDPLNPETALPIALNGNDKNTLGLAKPALKRVKYGARYEEEYAMGSRYPVVRASARGGAEDVEVIINAQTNQISDALLALIEQAPILLFRPLPTWGSLPALAYTIGDVEEVPLNRDRGGGFTQWLTGGKLVAPVSRGPVKGQITHQMVQDNLAGRTHASIQASSGNKRHIEIQANPLGLGQ